MNREYARTLAILTLGLLSSSAFGADLKLAPATGYVKAAPVSTYSWTGVYLGGFVDYGANFANSFAAMPGALTLDLNQVPHGPGVGGDLEALWQVPNSNWVWGARAEISYANLSATGNLNAGPGVSLNLSNATNYLGAFNAELGYAMGSDDRLLAYLTGGFAFGGAKPNLAAAGLCIAAPGVACTQAINDTSVGWDLGGGLRYAIPNTVLTIGIEGQYYQLGGKSLAIGPVAAPILTSSTGYNIFEQKVTASFKF